MLTDDSRLRELNAIYRGLDEPTDVLSFAADREHVPDSEPPYLGDIMISVECAARGAADSRRALAHELRLLAVHGLLHLLGHQDETEEQAARMRDLEVQLGVRSASDRAV